MPGRGRGARFDARARLAFDSRTTSPYNLSSLPGLTERCWSGRTGLPAKQLSGVNPDRGFESLPLRHLFPLKDRFGPGDCSIPEPASVMSRGVGRRGGKHMFKAVNPATGELIREFPEHDEDEVHHRLERAQSAFNSWRRFGFAERAGHLTAVADLLRERSADFARLMTEEMGKTFAAAGSEVDKCAWVCDFYAENAARFLAQEPVATDATKSFIRYEPLGPVLAIMPWNFPFWQFFRFAAPALMAGNVALLKHAANVPGSALAIDAVFRDAGYPKGVFTNLPLAREHAEALIE